MLAVITGDIVDSRKQPDSSWSELLERLLDANAYKSSHFDIYRGDSFQLAILEPENALKVALKIKSALKQSKSLDARMAIGIDKSPVPSTKVTATNGEAYTRSGNAFDTFMDSKHRLTVSTPWPEVNAELNLELLLASQIMDQWTPASATLMTAYLYNPKISQQNLADRLGIKQSSVSERKSRAQVDLILLLESRYSHLILKHLKR